MSFDLVFLGIVAAALVAAFRAGRRAPDDLEAFLLADRLAPGWLSGAALVAVDATALTVVALPALSFARDLRALPFLLGAAVARVWGAYALAPALRSAEGLSVYSLLGEVFGPRTRRAAGAVFVLSRVAAAGVRLAAAAAALSVLCSGSPAVWGLALLVLALALCLPRGLSGVLASDVVQCAALAACVLIILGVCVYYADGGLASLWLEAQLGGRLTPALWGPRLGHGFLRAMWRTPDVAAGAFLTGAIASAAAFGADHEGAQKIMAAASEGEAGRSLLWAAAGSLLLSFLFLLSGAALFGLYRLTPAFSLPNRAGDIVAHFAGTVLSPALRAVATAAVVLAAADLPLTSLSASVLDDFGLPARLRSLRWARALCAAFAAVIFLWALGCAGSAGLGRWSFEVSTIGFGALLGLVCAAVLSSAGTDRAALALGLALVIAGAVAAAAHMGEIRLSWTWLGPIAALSAAALAGPYGLG